MQYYDLPSGKLFLVGLKALIIKDDTLLVLKNVLSEHVKKEQWELPGGLVEINETLEEALVREVLEETHLNINILSPLSTWSHWFPNFAFKDGKVRDVNIVEIA